MNCPVVVNADDLGLSREINQGIFAGLEQGVISDVSLLVFAPHAREAARTLLGMGLRGVGLHVNLDAQLGWSSPGRERLSRRELGDLLEKHDHVDRLREDIRSQIERFIDWGLEPVHIDTHHHVHGFFPIFRALVELARQYRIPAVRYSPSGYTLTTREPIPYDEPVYRGMEEMLRAEGIFFCSVMVEGAGRLGDLGAFPAELVVHPSSGGDPWRNRELETLMDESFSWTLAARGIELAGFRDLVGRD